VIDVTALFSVQTFAFLTFTASSSTCIMLALLMQLKKYEGVYKVILSSKHCDKVVWNNPNLTTVVLENHFKFTVFQINDFKWY
jgi:NACalpha-BTF3-like transcription factor